MESHMGHQIQQQRADTVSKLSNDEDDHDDIYANKNLYHRSPQQLPIPLGLRLVL